MSTLSDFLGRGARAYMMLGKAYPKFDMLLTSTSLHKKGNFNTVRLARWYQECFKRLSTEQPNTIGQRRAYTAGSECPCQRTNDMTGMLRPQTSGL